MPNAISGLTAFIQAWDAAPRAWADEARVAVGPDGQINIEGSATCASAAIFVPSDPRFVEALEPGVRALCVALIDVLDCVTYSSCQGHRATEAGGHYRRRHVGIVPRDPPEAKRLESALETLCIETNAGFPHGSVRVLLVVGTVEGEEGERACLDLEFFGENVDADRYFRETERVTSAFVEKLRQLRA